jgi:hypothetical protein
MSIKIIKMKAQFKTVLISICFIFFTIASTSVLYAQTAQQVAKKAFTSTVLLVMEDASGRPSSLGSGFFVRQDVIVTNLHVVKGASRGYAKVIGKKAKFNIIGADTDRDLVLLKVSVVRGVPLSLGNSENVEVGEPIYVMGNPQGLEGTFSQGIVSSIRNVKSGILLQITAPISPGSSGGPVLNEKGEAIGVSVATFKEGQNLNFAIPSNYLKILLGQQDTFIPLGEVAINQGKKSLIEDFGGPSTEGVVIENLTFDGGGLFSFSLVNKMRVPVRNIYGHIIFYDLKGNPLDVVTFNMTGDTIPAGLAKRTERYINTTVMQLNTPSYLRFSSSPQRPQGRIEYRILDFQIGEGSDRYGRSSSLDDQPQKKKSNKGKSPRSKGIPRMEITPIPDK